MPVRCFDKSKFINSGIGAQRDNETDIRPFGGFNGTDSAIMGGMHITNLEPCPLSGQPARTKCTQSSLMGYF